MIVGDRLSFVRLSTAQGILAILEVFGSQEHVHLHVVDRNIASVLKEDKIGFGFSGRE